MPRLVSCIVRILTLSVAVIAASPSQGASGNRSATEGTAILSRCNAHMATPELDPIRTKVLLTSPPVGTPVSILSNHDLPSPAEQTAIEKWSELRDQCEAEFRVFVHSARALPRRTAFERQQIGLIYDEGLTLIRELVLALYERRLDYGEFAARRAAASIEIQRAEQQTREAIMIADPQRRLAHLDMIFQRLRNSLALLKSSAAAH
jgi:hypothetical protein